MAGTPVKTNTDALGLGAAFFGPQGDALEDEFNKVVTDLETLRGATSLVGSDRVHSASLTALTGVGLDIDAAGSVPDAETNQAVLVELNGEKYVSDYFARLEVDASEAVYQASPGHFAWYESADGQAALEYQNTPYGMYLGQIQDAIDEMLAE